MIDLVKHVPETANYDKLIIVAGGESLPDHLDAICDKLESDPKCLLFDVNAHLARNRFDRLKDHKGLKFIFSFDFGHKKTTTQLVEGFMKLPNTYLLINDIQPSKMGYLCSTLYGIGIEIVSNDSTSAVLLNV